MQKGTVDGNTHLIRTEIKDDALAEEGARVGCIGV